MIPTAHPIDIHAREPNDHLFSLLYPYRDLTAAEQAYIDRAEREQGEREALTRLVPTPLGHRVEDAA